MNRQGVISLTDKNKKSFAFLGGQAPPSDADQKDLLQFALESGMIDLGAVRDEMAKQRRNEILSQHNHSIWKGKDGRWYTYVDLPNTGDRYLKSRKRKADLEDYLVDFYREQEENPMLKVVFHTWIDRKLELEKITQATHYRYLGTWKRHFSEFGERKIRDIDEDDIMTFLEEQVPMHQLTQKGFANLKTLVRGMFRYAKRKHLTDISIEELLRDTDMTEIRFRRCVKADDEEVYTEDEADKIFRYLIENQDDTNLCILLMFVTGMRVGEAVTLKHEDLGDNFVNVRRTESRYKVGKAWQRTIKDFPKTLAGWRSIAVPDAYVWVIDRCRRLHPFEEWVFPNKRGMWLSTFSVRTRLKVINRQLGITQKSPHKIRKTYGSILLDNNIDMKMVMVQMGHADIITTERAYHRNRRTLDRRQQIISSIPEFQKQPAKRSI